MSQWVPLSELAPNNSSSRTRFAGRLNSGVRPQRGNMIGHKLLTTALLIAATTATAETTICKIPQNPESLLPDVISWDTATKKAKAKFKFDGASDGTLTYSRPHDSGANKVNLVFRSIGHKKKYVYEFIVYPVNNSYRVFGAAYETNGQELHLAVDLGNKEADCSSI